MTKLTLGGRMKRYEEVTQNKLPIRSDAIIRIDGRAFHTFTRPFEKPFDQRLTDAMVYATQETMKTISGAIVGYTQSDEASIWIVDYATYETQAPFDYNVQKLVSTAASTFSMHFYVKLLELCAESGQPLGNILPTFDARIFTVPSFEVGNYFYWRIQDARRNSISMYGRKYFSQKQMHGKKGPEVIEMLKPFVDYEQEPEFRKSGTAFDYNFKPIDISGNSMRIDSNLNEVLVHYIEKAQQK